VRAAQILFSTMLGCAADAYACSAFSEDVATMGLGSFEPFGSLRKRFALPGWSST